MKTDKNYLKILAKLRGLRAEERYTLVTVGKAIGVSHNTLSDYENGKYKLPVPVLLNLLEFYKVDVDIFFTNLCDNIRK